MQFVPVDNTAEFHMIFTYQGQVCENVFHVSRGTQYTEGMLIDTCETFKLWWDASIRSGVPAVLVLERIEAIAMDTPTSAGVVYSTGLPLAGQASPATPLPNNVTVAVKWSTGLRGRSYRGRTYHMGLTEAQISGNYLTNDERAALILNYEDLMAAIEDSDQHLVVVSKFHNKAIRSSGVATWVTGVSVDATLDSQRRRLPGRGA